jgi:SSS family solute:Na+ symporter
MSTISSQLNWGTSYVINDFYKRFAAKQGNEKHYVLVSRIATIIVMGLSVIVTANMKTISGAWSFIIEAGAGLGLVLILRWYWWRVNAWSEIAATIAPIIGYWYVSQHTRIQFPESLFVIVAFTTVVWLGVTFLTKPTDESTLIAFFRRVHPGGPFWKPIAQKVPDVKGDSGLSHIVVDWIAGVVLVYMILFGTGKLLFGDIMMGLAFYAVAAVAGWVMYRDLSKQGWGVLSG